MERTLFVEPWTLFPASALWSNTTPTSPAAPTPLPGSWGLVYALVPPYIFLISVLGLLFNAFVLTVFFLSRDHLSVADFYLENLALADFLLMSCLPFWATNILAKFNWPHGDAMCKIVNSAIVVNLYVSILRLAMVSVDRYLALVKTMKALWLRRTLYAKMICFVIWILAILLSLPTIVHRRVAYVEELDRQYFRKKVWSVYRRARGKRRGEQRGSDMSAFQKSQISTYINRSEQIKPVVLVLVLVNANSSQTMF
uniref:G-protein coupled receptors family 1 profile domain-containing protein n=1 Tax=Knipowitschia caucasica TaxID=637954 RepID=A0AAV2JJW1_KNICA